MAQLDIQRKESSGWIWWIIGLVILAALAWWFFSGRTTDTAVSDGSVVGAPAVEPMTNDGPITDLAALIGTGDMMAVMGRKVVLMNTPVTSVVSDKGFWAGSGTAVGQGVFVVRGNQDSSFTAPDGAVDAGKPVNIYGRVQAMPAILSQAVTTWNLASTDSSLLSTHKIYIQADSVRLSTP